MIRAVLVVLFTAVLALVTFLYFHLGVSLPVTIQQETRGPLELLYTTHIGPYNLIGEDLQEIQNWAWKEHIDCPATFGEYLDDPHGSQDRLRAHVGCVLHAPLEHPTETYTFESRPARKYVVGRFQGSPAIGPYKVYPKIQSYIEAHRLKTNGPVIEIYHINGEKVTTEYLFPIE